MNKFVVLFTATMFLAVFALIGCNKSQEPPKAETTPAQEPAAQEPETTPAKKKPVVAKPLSKTGNVIIIVKDMDAKPINYAVVSVKMNQETIKTVKTNTAGKAQFNGLPIGSYTFTAAVSGADPGSHDAVNINVAVPRGETATRTITLRIRQ